MNPNDLPKLGPIINGHHGNLSRFLHLHSIEGENVLCLGFSEQEIEDLVDPFKYREICLLTNWVDQQDGRIEKYPLVVGDITARTEFEDEQFDSVLTLSLFEHLHDLDAALCEIKRTIKPGGYLFAHFGPAWSSPYGHHLYSNPEDPL